MTDKELKRLSRAELLELLLIQTRETERLQVKLEAARQQLEDRQLCVSNAGDLAHAVLEINHVMGAAQEAANQYLANIAIMEQQTRERCERMLAEAQAEADRILSNAKADSPEHSKSLEQFLGEVQELISQQDVGL